MLETLQKHLTPSPKECVVGSWISGLDQEYERLFKDIIENSKAIKVASLYKDLQLETQLPFKITAFRAHLRGYCACQ